MYKSINNLNIKCAGKISEISPELVKLLSDPMTLEPMQYPIYIKKSHQIYDHDSIIQSLKYSNKDPNTGIDLDANKVEFLPCINYYIALLCIEEKNKKYYYHHPYGNLPILMEFGTKFYDNNKLKNKLLNDMIYLDIATYLPKKKYNFEYITIEEILCKCPITYRNMYKNSILSDYGIMCHANTSSIFKNGTWLTLLSFKSDEEHNIIHNDSIHELLKLNIIDDKFEFESSDDEDNDSENIKIKYKDQIKLSKYNYTNVDYEIESLYDIFEDNERCHDWYLNSTTTHFTIRQQYINGIKLLDDKIVDKLSKLVTSSLIVTNHDENRNFVELKEFYKFPTFFDSKNMSYGSDLSFLNIHNIALENEYMKMVYFVGSTLKNCVFRKVKFSCCVLIETTFIDCTFDDCKFSECSLYKTDSNILKLTKNCKIDQKTINSYYLVKM